MLFEKERYMSSPVRDKNFVKVFVLYLLENIGYPLDYNTINDIVIQDGYVGYFDFAPCFAEMLEDGIVLEIKDEDGTCKYMASNKGSSIAENLSGDILSEIRDRSLKSALRLLSLKKRGAELHFSREDDENGNGILVTCEVTEHGKTVYKTTLRVDSEARAEKIHENFIENPEVILRGTLALLSGDVNFIF